MQLPHSSIEITHQNALASMPLIMPVHIICNTSDEEIYSNIRTNTHNHPHGWIKCEDEHDGVAIIVGSAPSMLENLEKIEKFQRNGGKVYALNNAANILAAEGIFPDYQVILDAREKTCGLIGPAVEHLFASQVHPECFVIKPSARIWHLQVGDIEDHFPEYDEPYALIGGAASVGNTATCLAFAMGFRNLQVFGMDSSFKDGASHAVHQAINDGEPCVVVKYNGKEYRVSLTMKLQAEKFQETSKALQDAGCSIEVHGDGLLPEMWRNPQDMSEEDKYTLMWAQPDYRTHSPGERLVNRFLDIVKPQGKVIDFGCGCGRAAMRIAEYGCDVTLLDFAENSRDEAARSLQFFKQDLTKQINHHADYGYCTDVLEHIPTDDVQDVIDNIMTAAPRVFFQISTISDTMGAIIGQELHLTIKPHSWWKALFESHGYKILWEEEQQIAALFYIEKA